MDRWGGRSVGDVAVRLFVECKFTLVLGLLVHGKGHGCGRKARLLERTLSRRQHIYEEAPLFGHFDRTGTQRDEHLLLDFVEFDQLKAFVAGIEEDAKVAAFFAGPN